MDLKAKQIFEANSKLKAVYKVKGVSIFFSSEESAKAHKEETGVDYEVIKRADVFPKEDDADGLPDTSWKNDQIKSFMDDYEIAYEDKDTKSILLEKVEDAQTPAE